MAAHTKISKLNWKKRKNIARISKVRWNAIILFLFTWETGRQRRRRWSACRLTTVEAFPKSGNEAEIAGAGRIIFIFGK